MNNELSGGVPYIHDMTSGIYNLSELQEAIMADQQRWRPLVFTNGCFDLIHAGHVRYLQVAKSLGRSLIVGLNSDKSVHAIKSSWSGTLRPIVPEEQRAEVLAALRAVDGVVIFDAPTATCLIEVLNPDIYVKGDDYSLENLPEAPVVRACGGQIELVKVEIPTSTTAIINRILSTKRDVANS